MTRKILITGKNSYIGTSFIEYCQKNNIDFDIDELSVRGDEWKKEDFSKYDVVLNIAGIVHQKEKKRNKDLYYEVNRDLAVEIANKVKKESVAHFIQMSTMSVYGLNEGKIDNNTPPRSLTAYGESKLQADEIIQSLAYDDFIVSIIRPPMVYGAHSPGNYTLLSRFAQKSPLFPNINNQRSMIYIDNLSEFFIGLMNHPEQRIYHPQNPEYVNVSKMIYEISKNHNHSIYFTKLFNGMIKNLNLSILNKVFGTLIYSKELSQVPFEYQVYNFQESIRRSENG